MILRKSRLGYKHGRKMAKQEIKTETNWAGKSKEVIYEGGKKVGETRHETTFFGTPQDRTYDTKGNQVSETRHETTLFGTPRDRTYDTKGNQVSETRQENTLFGKRTVIVEKGQKVATIKRNPTFGDALSGYNGRKSVEGYSGRDIDPLTRTTRSGVSSSSSGVGAGGNTSSRNYGPQNKNQPKPGSPLDTVLQAKEEFELSGERKWTTERLMSVLGGKRDISFITTEMRYLAQNGSDDLRKAVMGALDGQELKRHFMTDRVELTKGDLSKLSKPTLELIVETGYPNELFEGAIKRVHSDRALAKTAKYKEGRIGMLAARNMSYDGLMSIVLGATDQVVDYCVERFGTDILRAVAMGGRPSQQLRASKKLHPHSKFKQYLSRQVNPGFGDWIVAAIITITQKN